MVKKKVLAVAVAALMAVPVISMPASAKDGDIIKVGGLNVKLVTDFESSPNNLRCGMDNDKLFLTSDQDKKKLNFKTLSGIGVDKSMGVALGVQSDFTDADAVQDGIQYVIDQSANPDNINFVGMTDFLVHVDFSNEEVDDPAVNMNFTEWDYNDDGTPRMEENKVTGKMKNATTTWNIADDATNVYYYMADGDTDWTQKTGTSGWVAKVPKHFVGYVRIPVAAIDVASGWGDDDNDKMDLTHLTRVGIFYGFYGRDAKYDHVLAVDNFGFAGDWTSTDTTTNNSSVVTTTAQKSTDTTTKVNSNTNSNSNSNSTSNPTTGEAPMTAALVTAAVFAGVLVISKKKVSK